jgi:hypothetical protein
MGMTMTITPGDAPTTPTPVECWDIVVWDDSDDTQRRDYQLCFGADGRPTEAEMIGTLADLLSLNEADIEVVSRVEVKPDTYQRTFRHG